MGPSLQLLFFNLLNSRNLHFLKDRTNAFFSSLLICPLSLYIPLTYFKNYFRYLIFQNYQIYHKDVIARTKCEISILIKTLTNHLIKYILLFMQIYFYKGCWDFIRRQFLDFHIFKIISVLRRPDILKHN